AVTALARHTMRTAAQYEPSPARVLARLNEAVLAAERSQLLTAMCVRLAPVLGGRLQLMVASAGHPPPLLVRASGEVAAVDAAGLLGEARGKRAGGRQPPGRRDAPQHRQPRARRQRDVDPDDLARKPSLVLDEAHDPLAREQEAERGQRAAQLRGGGAAAGE